MVDSEGVCGPGPPALACTTRHAGLSLTLQQSMLGLALLLAASCACEVEGLGACRAWLSNLAERCNRFIPSFTWERKAYQTLHDSLPSFTACR